MDSTCLVTSTAQKDIYTGSSTYDQPPFWLVGRKSICS
jgi:hypothetical protein